MRLPALAFSALFGASLAIAAAVPALTVWPVDSLVKVFPDDAPGRSRAPQQVWLVARNGHASIQFALRPEAAVNGLEVKVNLGGGLAAQVRRAGYVPIRNTPKDFPADEVVRGTPGRYPDPLFEGPSFDIPAGEPTPFWITIHAPERARPGVYKGEAVFRAGGKKVARAPFQIRVVSAVVPPARTLKVTNWFSLDEQTLGRYYALGSQNQYWQLLGNIAQVIGAHRQNVILTPVFELTDARVNGDSLAYDFSRLDRWVHTFTKAGAADLIEGGHLLGRVNVYDSPLIAEAFVVENGAVVRKKLDPSDPHAEAHMNSFLPALYTHLKEKGWDKRYVQHVLDEAHGKEPPVYLRYVEFVRKHMPNIPTIDAIDQTAGLLGDACDIWVPQLGKFDNDFAAIREHVQKGGQAWYYTCLFPRGKHLNRFVDFPLLKTRLLHWFNFRHDFTGFLHWGGNAWGKDPFTDTETDIGTPQEPEVLPSGDAFITYPWREKNSIHSSVRLEAMLEGIEDYELLKALAAKDPDKARRLAEKAIPNVTDYVRDLETFRRLQAELLGAE